MIKNYFPIDQSKSLKKKILIQPLFVDQKVKNSKEIKGLGDNTVSYTHLRAHET